MSSKAYVILNISRCETKHIAAKTEVGKPEPLLDQAISNGLTLDHFKSFVTEYNYPSLFGGICVFLKSFVNFDRKQIDPMRHWRLKRLVVGLSADAEGQHLGLCRVRSATRGESLELGGWTWLDWVTLQGFANLPLPLLASLKEGRDEMAKLRNLLYT